MNIGGIDWRVTAIIDRKGKRKNREKKAHDTKEKKRHSLYTIMIV